MISTMRRARVAGILYLIFFLMGFFELYVSFKLTVAGSAPETIGNILKHQLLFRIEILDGLLTAPVWIAVVIALYLLLEGVSRKLSTLMVILVVVQVPVTFLSVTNWLVTLELAKGIPALASFSDAQKDALGMLMLHINSVQNTAMELFWGLWLFPLGILVYKSRFLPRFLGVWLNLNGIAYVVLSVGGIFAPEHVGVFFKFALPLLLGEAAFTLWLVILGARDPQQRSTDARDVGRALP